MNLGGVKICMETEGLKPNYSALGRYYNLDRRTVKKMLEGVEKKVTKERKSALDDYVDLIKEKLNIPGSNMKAVYEFIKTTKDDSIGSYSNFRKYVNKNDELIKTRENTAKVRFETDLGMQLQFDWKGPITLHFKNGIEIVFYVFSATLSSSRFHCFIYSKFMVLEEVERCLIEVFKMIGGIPKEILTDNMSSIVNYSQHDFTKEFKAFCRDMGTIPKHCKVNHAWTKGKDESCNRFVNWLKPYDYEFESEEELIEILKNINIKVNREKNQTTNIPPITLFEKEKEYLQPMPNQVIIENYLETLIPVKVQNTMLFYYKGCQYSVPKKYINLTLKVKELDNKLYVYYNKKLIVTHDITDKKVNYRENDYIEGLSSSMPEKSIDQIETLAAYNLELLDNLNNERKKNNE